jgi:hypothetical protein
MANEDLMMEAAAKIATAIGAKAIVSAGAGFRDDAAAHSDL